MTTTTTTDEALDALARAATIATYYTMTATFYTVDACDAAVTALKNSNSYRLLRDLVHSSAPPDYPGLNPWNRRDRAFWLHGYDTYGTPVRTTHLRRPDSVGAGPEDGGGQEDGEEEFVDVLDYADTIAQATQRGKEILTPKELAQVHLCRERAMKEIRESIRPDTERDGPLTEEEESYALKCWDEAFNKTVEEHNKLVVGTGGEVQEDVGGDGANVEWEDVFGDVLGVEPLGNSKAQGLESDRESDAHHETDRS